MKKKFVEELEDQPITEVAAHSSHREIEESAQDRQNVQESKRNVHQKTKDKVMHFAIAAITIIMRRTEVTDSAKTNITRTSSRE